jgi:hypothetical protein
MGRDHERVPSVFEMLLARPRVSKLRSASAELFSVASIASMALRVLRQNLGLATGLITSTNKTGKISQTRNRTVGQPAFFEPFYSKQQGFPQLRPPLVIEPLAALRHQEVAVSELR